MQNNCHRHNVPCEYDRPAAPPDSPLIPRSGSVPNVTSASPSSSTSAGYRGDNTADSSEFSKNPGLGSVHWEMRAFHHFTVATSRTLPGSHIPAVHECWSVQVPKLALDYEPLLNTLIAVSTLHLILTPHGDPGPVDPALLACRTTYLDAALRTHRQMLSQLSPQTADSACFTSVLLLIDAFAVLQSRALEPYEPPARWMRIVQGARTVFEAAIPLVSADGACNITAIISSSPASMSEPSELFTEANLQRFPYLLEQSDEALDPETRAVYRETISCMGGISFAVESGELTMALCRRLMSFACLVPPPFLDLVEARTPRALVILAHFFALTSQARELWRVGNTPEREVQAIRHSIPPRLRHLLNWPVPCLGRLNGQ